MKTISLRFADNYAPKEGTIKLHQNIIDKMVMYGMANLVILFRKR